MNLCTCGCGREIARGRKWAHGHHKRGTPEVQSARSQKREHIRRRVRSLTEAKRLATDPKEIAARIAKAKATRWRKMLRREAAKCLIQSE